MEYLLGALVVVAVLAFVVLPLLRGQRTDRQIEGSPDPARERADIYRELLELELDQKVGKLSESDFKDLSDGLLDRAATLIAQQDASSTTAEAELEREIAEARVILSPPSTDGAPSPRAEESRAWP